MKEFWILAQLPLPAVDAAIADTDTKARGSFTIECVRCPGKVKGQLGPISLRAAEANFLHVTLGDTFPIALDDLIGRIEPSLPNVLFVY